MRRTQQRPLEQNVRPILMPTVVVLVIMSRSNHLQSVEVHPSAEVHNSGTDTSP